MEFAVALVVAIIVTPIAALVARRTGIIDRPGPLKTHRSPVPYLGGFAVFAGAVVGVIGAGRVALVVPLVLALALGTADDVHSLRPRLRLTAELGIGVAAALVVPGPVLVQVATGGLVVVLLNAVNLLDGQDGLATAVALVSALALATFGGDAQSYALGLAGALAGFLVFNRPPARIYLGDGGSYLIGTALALAPALALGSRSRWSVWCAVPLIVALPLADTAIAVVRRARLRRPLFSGDRSHIYDQLVDGRWTVAGSTTICALAQVAFAGFGVVVARLSPGVAALGLAAGVVTAVVGAGLGGFVASPDSSSG